MRDRLRKYRKENQAEKRFGKDINVSTTDEPSLRKPMSAAETKSVSKAQPKSGASPLSFGAAFASARKDGDKTFTWKGKSYSTQLASEKKAAPTRRAAPATAAKAAPAKAQAAPTKVEKPSLAAAFDRAGTKPAPFTSVGKTPRLLNPASSTAPSPARERAEKLARLKREAEATGASRYAQDRYRYAKETNMYAKGGKIDGCAVRGKTKAGRK